MSHELTDEQRDVRELARRFADEVVEPQAGRWDREHTFPREVFTQLGELGLMGVCVPERFAGAGADYLTYVLVLGIATRAFGVPAAPGATPNTPYDGARSDSRSRAPAT